MPIRIIVQFLLLLEGNDLKVFEDQLAGLDDVWKLECGGHDLI